VLVALIAPGTPCLGDELKLIPQISIRNRYNDNIFYDAGHADRISDFSAVISPGIRLTERTETLDAFLRSRLERIEYAEEEDLNATDQYHDGRIRCRLSEMLRASAEAGYTRDSQVDRDIETTGLALGTSTRKRSHYAGSVDMAFSEKASALLSYSYDEDRFRDPEFTDSTTQSAELTCGYNLDAVLRQTTARLTAGYALFEYPYEDSTNLSLMAGMLTRVSETVELSLDAGGRHTRSTYDYPGIVTDSDTARGGLGRVMASYRGEVMQASLSAYHDIRAISGEPGTVKRTSVRYDIRRRFTYELSADFNAEYFLNRQDSTELSSGIDEKTLRFQPRVTYAYTPDLRLEASYRYARIRDDEEDQVKRQNLVYVGFTWQYPLPR
jgi:hypothetical protein